MEDRTMVPNDTERGGNLPEMTSLMKEKEPQSKPQRSLYQRLFNDIRFFTLCYCLSNLLSNTVIVYIVSQITALEREFQLTSSQTGFLISSMDLGVLTTTIIVGYLANKVHIPKILALTTLVFGFTSLQNSLPHFIFGLGDTDYSNDTVNQVISDLVRVELCQDSNASIDDQCSATDQHEVHQEAMEGTISFWIVVIGCVLNGIALAPRYPFFVTFVDNNTEKSKSGFYIGVSLTSVGIGGVVAFGFSGVFSNLHVTLQEVDIDPLHPRWIGAWWLGFIIFGIVCILASVPLFFFPRKFDTGADTEVEDVNRVRDGDESKLMDPDTDVKEDGLKTKDESTKLSPCEHIQAYFRIVWHLFKNPVFVLTELSTLLVVFSIAGSGGFTPKYIELQYMVPAWQANIITSGVMLCAAGGALLGGWITARKSMTPTRNLKISIIIVFICFLMDSCAFLLACDYYDFSDALENPPGCQTNCSCDTSAYSPVCGDNQHYLSPCAAGCLIEQDTVYKNCRCVDSGMVEQGLCDRDCTMYLVLFVIIKVINGIGLSLANVTVVMMLIRSVDESDKSMAVALSEFFTSILAWLPGPIVFGKLVDGTCMIWDTSCNSVGACLLYNLPQFRYVFNGLICGCEFTAAVTLTITLYFRLRLDKRVSKEQNDVVMEIELPLQETESPVK